MTNNSFQNRKSDSIDRLLSRHEDCNRKCPVYYCSEKYDFFHDNVFRKCHLYCFISQKSLVEYSSNIFAKNRCVFFSIRSKMRLFFVSCLFFQYYNSCLIEITSETQSS